MLIAWQAINKVMAPNHARYAKRFLIVTPGITIRDRLGVLHPEREDNYYRERDLVPSDLWDPLLQAQIQIVNYHTFRPRDAKEIQGVAANTPSYFVEGGRSRQTRSRRRPRWSLRACCVASARIGARSLCSTMRRTTATRTSCWSIPTRRPTRRSGAQPRCAGVVPGLSNLRRKSGIKAVYDLSATPYYLKGSGYNEGFIFPWVVSDFLADGRHRVGDRKDPARARR